MMLKHLIHTMWLLQICYVPKFVEINTSCDWLNALLPSIVKNVKCTSCRIKKCRYKM